MDGTPLAVGIDPVPEEGKAEAALKRLDKAKVARLARVTAWRVKQVDVAATCAWAAKDQSCINAQKYREALEEQAWEENAAVLEGVQERQHTQREEQQLRRDAATTTEELEELG